MRQAVAVAAALLAVVFAASSASSSPEVFSDFEWIWDTFRTQLFDSTLVDRFFTEANRRALGERARAASSPDELAVAVTPCWIP